MQWLVDVLNSPVGTPLVCLAGFALVAGILLSKKGLLTIHTKSLSIGAKDTEQRVIREQATTAYNYVMSIEGVIHEMLKEHPYGGFKTKWILERIYDEVITWIIYNHITEDEEYVATKCDKMTDMLYGLGVTGEFRTKEFRDAINRYVSEMIRKLVRTRKLYENMEAR